MKIITAKNSVFVLILAIHGFQAEFILNEVNMNEATYQACQYCDARSDRAGSRAAASALRDYMTKNFIKVVVDGGEVNVKQTYPNEIIDTGHSCKYRAEARNIVAMAKMIPGSVELDPSGVIYIDEVQNSIAVADVAHEFKVHLDVRVRMGFKFFGKCKKLWQKTCSTVGKATGINKISANFVASNVLVECIGGQEHLTFNMDATVIDEAKGKTYGAVTVHKKDDCNLKLGVKIGSINGKIKKYASKYINGGDKFHELRGPKLIAELQRKLGAKLGSLVTIKINDENGNPRPCSSRRKRSTKCVRKTCPPGFTRIGETDMCQKYFGRTRPDCRQFGSTAKLIERQVGVLTFTLYWCHVPRQ